jgi:hypothetical protein
MGASLKSPKFGQHSVVHVVGYLQQNIGNFRFAELCLLSVAGNNYTLWRIQSSQLLNATKDRPSIFALQRNAKGLQHPLQFHAGPFATARGQSRSQLPSVLNNHSPTTILTIT